MSDDLTDEQLLLASAYLDDDVTSAERARVDADPNLAAAVDRLRLVRTALGEQSVTAISTRERHLAAALDAWDRLSDGERTGDHSGGVTRASAESAAAAGAASVTAPTPLAERRLKKTPGWVLTAAAAVLVVAGGALVVQRILTDSGATESSDATEASAEPVPLDVAAVEAPVEEAVNEAFDEAPAAELGVDSPEPRIDDIVDINSPARLAEVAAQILAGEALLDTADLATEAADAPASGQSASEEPADGTELGATDAITARDFTCGLVDRIIGEAEYGTGLDLEPVAIGVDEAETEVIAFRVETCDIVASAPLGD